ncbi:MAG TPA: FkbM family methyltransferase [Stellaceae bacterium]
MPPPVTVIKDCRHGRMMFLPHDQYVGRALDLYGEYGEIEARTLAQLVKPGQTVVEVGANMGAHTVHLGRLVGPSGQVIAFEPQRAMFYLLCANLALNDLFHVMAYRIALGDAPGNAPVPLVDVHQPANFGGKALFDPGPTEQVLVRRVDGLALPALHLLKIDVEGMEMQVLRGARETIARYRPIIYAENDRRGKSPALIRLLVEYGYDLYWDLPPLYNSDNFARNPTNVFPRLVSANLLCLPKERQQPISGFRPVTGPDDWMLSGGQS